ncbi:MAG: ATP:cob(I)alamin adenosyltransferase [Elusimicrobia bacterium]|nr:ATP:cob(I)alamin adenosyltransferase [Elusimicrobiota bacterium]
MSAKFKPFLGSGDNGFTDLLAGRRVRKTDLRIRINALIDELNCLLGLIKAKSRRQRLEVRGQRSDKECARRDLLCKSGRIKNEINGIQKDLILVSASIAGLKSGRRHSLPACRSLGAGRRHLWVGWHSARHLMSQRLVVPPQCGCSDKKIKQAEILLEQKIANLSKKLPPAKKFIIPGKTETEALVHHARAKARIIEILLWAAKSEHQAVYFNRLSDYLFLLARSLPH